MCVCVYVLFKQNKSVQNMIDIGSESMIYELVCNHARSS